MKVGERVHPRRGLSGSQIISLIHTHSSFGNCTQLFLSKVYI